MPRTMSKPNVSAMCGCGTDRLARPNDAMFPNPSTKYPAPALGGVDATVRAKALESGALSPTCTGLGLAGLVSYRAAPWKFSWLGFPRQRRGIAAEKVCVPGEYVVFELQK